MNFKKQSVLCGIVSSLILVSTFISVAYSLTQSIYYIETPFHLSVNYMKFVKESPSEVKVQDVIDAERDSNVTVLSEYTGEEYAALYDPRMYFYEDMVVYAVGATRYFSNKDYAEKRKVGILLKDVDWYTGFYEKDQVQTPLIEECIFHINSENSRLYRESIHYIVNQTSLENMGDVVYVDSDDKADRNAVRKRLLSAGYTEAETIRKDSRSFIAEPHSAVMLFASLMLYPVFLFACVMCFWNFRRLLKIHKLNGGTNGRIFWELAPPFLCVNVIASAVLGMVSYLYMELYSDVFIFPSDLIIVWAAHIAVTSLSFWIGYCYNVVKIDLRMGENDVK